jgi:hypothetical protein
MRPNARSCSAPVTPLTRYLDEIRKRAVTLQTISNALETLPVGAQRTGFVNGKSEHQVWFNKQLESLADNFKPFLKLDKRQRARGRWCQNRMSLMQRALALIGAAKR